MSSTPRTPAPSKFFLPKRSTQSSSQAPRFQPTPRFASSGPRSTQPSRTIEDVDENELDVFSGTEEPSEFDDEDENLGAEVEVAREELPRRARRRLSPEESIEVESIVGSDSQGGDSSADDEMPQGTWRYNVVDADLEEPMPSSPLGVSHERQVAKRRKISISPLASSSPQAIDQVVEDLFKQQSQQGPEDKSLDFDFSGSHDSDGSLDLSDRETKNHGPQQPTFRAPPRFKPLEDEVQVSELPDFFSPRRRGEKYIPGGLAAGLQGWLSEIREGEGKDGNVESTIRIVVEDLRPGSNMKLVRGRRLGESQEQQSFIFAGEGRVVDLGKKPVLTQGSVAIIWQPFWDVKLGDITWTVACDWTIE